MKKIFLIISVCVFSSVVVKSQTPDPFIQSVINQTDLDSLVKYVNELTGEVSTTVNGNTVTILNRAGSTGNNDAADYLIQKLEGYGLTVTDQEYSGSGRNVFAEQVGTTLPDEKYIICAHYDAVTDYCADDNASGCAAVLEAARLLSGHEFPYTIVYALWDEEEIGLVGSGYYASQAASNGDVIHGVLNLEMFGWDSDDDGLYDIHTDTVADSENLAQILVDINTTYNLDIVSEVYNPGTPASDHSSFWDEGYTAVVFSQAFFGGDYNPYYHTSSDRISEFNLPYFHELSKLAIATLADLAMGDALPAPTATFIPENGAVDIDVASDLIVSFNTPVRKLDDSEITDPTEFIILKKNDGFGEDVSYVATINPEKTVFTINPTDDLEYNTTYYLEITDQIENGEDLQFNGANISFTTEDNAGIAGISPDDFSFYPNPVESYLNIDIRKEVHAPIKVEIINVAGAKVYEGEIYSSKHEQIDISSLSSGMYFINLTNENFVINKKIFKQ